MSALCVLWGWFDISPLGFCLPGDKWGFRHENCKINQPWNPPSHTLLVLRSVWGAGGPSPLLENEDLFLC